MFLLKIINKKILLTQNKFSLVNKVSNFINNEKISIKFIKKVSLKKYQ